VSPLSEIDACDVARVARVTRPEGPRTPAPSLWRPRCDPFRPFILPAPTSGPPRPGGLLRAGFDSVDITPAPGLGTLGWGTEATVGQGHRNRLKARALVLEDADGELLALAVVDLDAVSTILHRVVAERVDSATGGAIGADRLILSATHTHSAPGGFLSSWPLNLAGSPVMGFDYAFVTGVADRIAAAVAGAHRTRVEARAAWAVATVWGRTRNRMLDAHRRNPEPEPFPVTPPGPPAPASLPDSARAVNPRWVMLRVEVRDGAGWTLAGTYSVFSIHGTMVPAGNELYDSDIQGAVTRALEDSLGGIHILANGTEGDISPRWSAASRCPVAAMETHPRPSGPRTPPSRFDWMPRTRAENAQCVERALTELETWRDSLVRDAIRIFHALDGRLAGGLPVRRNFETVRLTGRDARDGGLCQQPRVGMALAAGGHDGPTRLKGWRVLGLWPLGVDWGSVDPDSTECQSPKRVLLPFIQSRPGTRLQFDEHAQFAVLRVGNLWLGTVPAEATTVAGRQMMAALMAGAGRAPSDSIAIIGLANGYLNYVTTRDEYQAQTYEGGSTLYGPQSAGFMAGRLADLAAGIGSPNPTPVDTILVRPGPLVGLAWSEHAGRVPDPRPEVACAPGLVTVRWTTPPPALFTPAQGLMVTFTPEAGSPVADDDVRVEVRATDRGRQAWRWEAAWRPARRLEAGSRVSVRLPQSGNVAVGCSLVRQP
jgi:neutral ceramidase